MSQTKVCRKNSATRRFNSLTNTTIESLAGQMRSLKTGAAPKKRKQANDDSSDGSDTEGDVESESETDTDTDSDEE